jgi:bacterioferritin-associated ferredoxin
MKTRCECLELSFIKLMAYARRYNITDIEELIAATRCCTGCGSCRPYLEELLKTGKLRCGDQLVELPKVDVPLDIPPPGSRKSSSPENRGREP